MPDNLTREDMETLQEAYQHLAQGKDPRATALQQYITSESTFENNPEGYLRRQASDVIKKPINQAPQDPRQQATRRIAQAQPGVTTATRANDPANQNITTGLKYTPEVASALAMGPEVIAAPGATLGKLASSTVSGLASTAAARYGVQKLGGGEDLQDIVGYGAGMLGAVGGWHEPPEKLGYKGWGIKVPGWIRPEGAAADAAAEAIASKNVPPLVDESPIIKDSSFAKSSEGRPATWTNERVVELAKQNNPDAIEQVRLRKLTFPNQRYVTGEGSPFERGVNGPRNRMYPEVSNLDAGVGTPEAFKSPDWLEGINQMRKSVSKAAAEGAEPNVTDAMNKVIEETKDRLVNAPAGRTTAQPTISTDSMGTKWAEGPGGVRVSIPKRIPDSGVMEYARTKLAEQAAMQAKIKGSY